ncbi:hypothetical protein F0562_008470 [Nyssa sinensis]|uniref:O-methyltransferase domain-containing protein n=1 Tax=Nyssa sinensis TaxID=561372 RepID=A0A5J5AA77_9ASTE|nr:hypothetical protein F0562_008470 [Nyssa sinensis]
MDMANDELNRVLLHSQAHIWNHIFNFINSMSLKCAIQLDIPDIINNHGRPMTLSQLVAALPINQSKARCVYRLMRILVQSGFFVKQKVSEEAEEEGYLLTPAARLLLKDEPLSVTPFLLAMLDPILNKTMASYCKGAFKGLNSLVDVGGGTGTVAKSIADAFPHLNCTVFDLPHVVAGLEGSKNLNYVAGNMFEAIPPADAILLKWILHDWSDEESVKILKKCKEAIPSRDKGGKVMIIDMTVENQKGG